MVLGVDPKADTETIHQAYLALVADCNPKARNANKEKYDAVTLAYEVLADPAARAMFDSIRGGGSEKEVLPEFSGRQFFEALAEAQRRRLCVLSLLYDRRLSKPVNGHLSQRHMEAMVNLSSVELQLALFYLKQKGYVVLDDKSNLQVTVEGMDYLEAHRPSPRDILPLLKATAGEALEEWESGFQPLVTSPASAGTPAADSLPETRMDAIPGLPSPTSNEAVAAADAALHDAIELLNLAGQVGEPVSLGAQEAPARKVEPPPSPAEPRRSIAVPARAVAAPEPKPDVPAAEEAAAKKAPFKPGPEIDLAGLLSRSPKIQPKKEESRKEDPPPRRFAITK